LLSVECSFCMDGTGCLRELQQEPVVGGLAVLSLCDVLAASIGKAGCFDFGDIEACEDSGEPFDGGMLPPFCSVMEEDAVLGDSIMFRELGFIRSKAVGSIDCFLECTLLLIFLTRCAVLVGDWTLFSTVSSSFLTVVSS